MESPYRGVESVTSSKKGDRVNKEQPKNIETTSKHTYECNFCKRGFTNPQALGGHMNMHKKYRAKSKKATSSSSSLPYRSDQMCNQAPSFWKYYPSGLETQRSDYGQMGNQAQPVSTATRPRDRYTSNNFPFRQVELNFSLQTGLSTTHGYDGNRFKSTEIIDVDEEDVDLELRLGQYHP